MTKKILLVLTGLLASLLGVLAAEGELRSLSGLALGAPDLQGRLPVMRVRSDSPGALAGLRPGDWLVEINGESVRGWPPAQAAVALDQCLGEGFSAVVVFLRDEGPDVARLRPFRPLHHQRQLLEFRRAYLAIAAESDALWEEVRQGMEGAVVQGFPEEALDLLLREKLWQCRGLLTRLEGLAIPSLPDLRVGSFLAQAKHWGYDALRQREEALGVLADYVRRRRQHDLFEENLWLRLNGYARHVHRTMARGERDLLEGLSLVAHADPAFNDLLAREREEEELSRALAPEVGTSGQGGP